MAALCNLTSKKVERVLLGYRTEMTRGRRKFSSNPVTSNVPYPERFSNKRTKEKLVPWDLSYSSFGAGDEQKKTLGTSPGNEVEVLMLTDQHGHFLTNAVPTRIK